MKLIGRGTRVGALVAMSGLAIGLANVGPAGAATAAPGVTAHTITVGVITSETGPGASEYKYIIPAVTARIDQQNAEGGVDGRKIKIITEDDQSTPSGNAVAAQALLAKGVLAVIDSDSNVIAGSKVLQQAGEPTIGGGTGEAPWYTQPDTNMFSWLQLSPKYPANSAVPNFFKSIDVTKIASIGAATPSSAAAANSNNVAVEKSGLTSCLDDTTLQFGSTNVAPVALAMKKGGCTGAYLAMNDSTNFAIITAAKQAGIPLKAAISATGYGQTLLTTSAALKAGQGDYFDATGAPIELHNKATEAFQAALKKYDHFSGVPVFSQYAGWFDGDLLVKGLEVAGKNPTTTGFIDNLRKVSKYTDTGLIPSPANFTLADFGKGPAKTCTWILQLKGKDFVPVPSTGKPTCGTTIPGTTQAP